MINQSKNKTHIKIEYKSSGINYTLRDETINKTEFIPFENISNNSHEIFESNKSFRNFSIYTGVVGGLFLISNIAYGTRLWAWLFLLACPIFFILFKRSKTAYTVIGVQDKIDIYIIQEKNSQEIIEELFKSRDNYLRTQYSQIDYENDIDDELSKFRWLNSLGVISNREFEVIQDEIVNA